MIGFTEYTKANLKILLTERVRLFLFGELIFMLKPGAVLWENRHVDFVAFNNKLSKDSLWYKAFLSDLAKEGEKATNLYEFASFVVFNLGDVEKINEMVLAEKQKASKENLLSLFNEVFSESIHEIARYDFQSKSQFPPIKPKTGSKNFGIVFNRFESEYSNRLNIRNANVNFNVKKAMDAIKPKLDKQRHQISSTLKDIIDNIK